jgi:hypothetical protein
MWALQIRPTLYASMHTHSECNNRDELMEHRGSCFCCRECPNCYDYTRLFYIISRLLRLVFRLYALFYNQKSHMGLEVIADYWPIASSRTAELCSIQQRRRLTANQRPPRCLLPQEHRHQAHLPLRTHYGCRQANQHAYQDETHRPGYQGSGLWTSSCPSSCGPPVQVLDESAIMRIIYLISIIHIKYIIGIINIIRIIGITISAWVSCLNPRFHKISSIK